MQHHRVTNRFLLAFHRCLHLPRHRLPLFQCPLLLRRPLRLLKFIFFRSELAFNIGAFLKSKLSRKELNPCCKRWKSFIYYFFFLPVFRRLYIRTDFPRRGGKEQWAMRVVDNLISSGQSWSLTSISLARYFGLINSIKLVYRVDNVWA